jgi:23S rRNA (uridine2552-2'-O)-methyltransferase
MSTKKKQPKNYVVKDRYFFEAKRLGYRARSAFKLLEIQECYSLIRPGMSVLDLASAPGSFLQVLSKAVGPSGTVIGMDIQKMEAL